MAKKEELKAQILELTREYYKEIHAQMEVFEPGKSFVHYGGRSRYTDYEFAAEEALRANYDLADMTQRKM